ncbi:MAG: hypothetical protein J6C52_09705 [Clostridia bacterium]|nr:hypothetical protein [Clostridia bacterium]
MTNYQVDPSRVSSLADAPHLCRNTGNPVRVSEGGEEFVLIPLSKYREIEEELALAELDKLIEEGLEDDRAGRDISLEDAITAFRKGIRNV